MRGGSTLQIIKELEIYFQNAPLRVVYKHNPPLQRYPNTQKNFWKFFGIYEI